MSNGSNARWRGFLNRLGRVSNDLGNVCLGIAVVFFTRSFHDPYFQNIDFWMLIASVMFCLSGLMLRKGDNSD